MEAKVQGSLTTRTSGVEPMNHGLSPGQNVSVCLSYFYDNHQGGEKKT